MKNLYKKGFSLAEVLIAVAIISVIATMMVSIARQGVDDAYNLFYYTGYKGMLDAISYSLTTSEDNSFDNRLICKALDLTCRAGLTANENYVFPAKNGITFSRISTDAASGTITLTMSIPSAKGQNVSATMYYADGILVPGEAVVPGRDNIALYNRRDLLPFYIDDGVTGRIRQTATGEIIPHPDTHRDYEPYEYRNFTTAYCRLSNNRLNASATQFINARNNNFLNCGAGATTGVLRVANPRKVL